MKSRKFVGCEGRDAAKFPAKFPDLEGDRRGMHRRPLVWLLASAMAVLGTAGVSSAERPKSGSASSADHHKSAPHPKKAGEAEHHKDADHGKAAAHPKEAEHKKEGE